MVSDSTPLATRMPAVSYLHSSLTAASFLHLRFVIGNVVATNLYNDCSDLHSTAVNVLLVPLAREGW